MGPAGSAHGACRPAVCWQGDFRDNLFHGKGVYKWADGAVYTGGWQNNKMHGKGVYVDSDSVRWEGTFYNGKFKSHKSFILLR